MRLFNSFSGVQIYVRGSTIVFKLDSKLLLKQFNWICRLSYKIGWYKNAALCYIYEKKCLSLVNLAQMFEWYFTTKEIVTTDLVFISHFVKLFFEPSSNKVKFFESNLQGDKTLFCPLGAKKIICINNCLALKRGVRKRSESQIMFYFPSSKYLWITVTICRGEVEVNLSWQSPWRRWLFVLVYFSA